MCVPRVLLHPPAQPQPERKAATLTPSRPAGSSQEVLGALLPGGCCDITGRSEAKDQLVPGSTGRLSVQAGAGAGSVFSRLVSPPGRVGNRHQALTRLPAAQTRVSLCDGVFESFSPYQGKRDTDNSGRQRQPCGQWCGANAAGPAPPPSHTAPGRNPAVAGAPARPCRVVHVGLLRRAA